YSWLGFDAPGDAHQYVGTAITATFLLPVAERGSHITLWTTRPLVAVGGWCICTGSNTGLRALLVGLGTGRLANLYAACFSAGQCHQFARRCAHQAAGNVAAAICLAGRSSPLDDYRCGNIRLIVTPRLLASRCRRTGSALQ